jgi:TorA maturation chaperone TorD
MSDNMHVDIRAALLRAGISHSLARACGYPGPALCADMQRNWRTLLEFSGDWPAGMRELIVELAGRLRQSEVSVLSAEYVRLFGPAARCPLTETSWGDAGRLLGRAPQLADIGGFYRAFGIDPGAGRESLPEDHLAMELEFLSVLYLKEANALNVGPAEALEVTQDAIRKFLEQHVGTWIDAWFGQLRDCDPELFYVGLGMALQQFLSGECHRLALHPAELRARIVDKEMGADDFSCPMESSR